MDTASWQGPPTAVLGHAVPIQQFVARTEQAVIALQHVVAFPEGCILPVHLAVRRGSLDDTTGKAWWQSHFGAGPGPTEPEAQGRGMKLGVRFPDGSKATTVEHPFSGWGHPTDKPERPMLVEAGSDSSSNDQYFYSQQRLWLWPLPPPALFEFVIEWEIMGLDLISTVLDGKAIVRAAEQTVPFWV